MKKTISLVLVFFLFSFYCFPANANVVKMLKKTDFAIQSNNKIYTGKQIKPKLTTSINKQDFTVLYKKNINVGTATVIITGKNHYVGTVKKKFKIKQKNLKTSDFKFNKKTFVYTGKQIKPKISTKIKKKYYKVSYLNNIKKGTATAIIKGKGNYKGTVKKKFKIKGNTSNKPTNKNNFNNIDLDKTYKLKESYFKIDLSDEVYTGKQIKPKISTDLPKKYYLIEYENNIDVGTATITISGCGNYVGTIKKKFKIVPRSITSEDFRVDTDNKHFTNTSITPNVYSRLSLDDDYTLQYKDNVAVGTATIIITGKGNYKGTLEYHFNITQKALNKGLFDVNIDTVTYNGKAQEKTIKTDLKYNVDYTVRYSNNINVGTATVIITGKGNYSGEIDYSWRIVPQTINSAMFTVDTSNKIYTSNEIRPGVTSNIPSSQFTITYISNVNIGTATIVIRGINNYNGNISYNFNIVKPTVNKVGSLTLSLKNKVYIVNKWSKVSNATGYEMWRKKKGEDFKKVKTFSGANTTSYTTDKKSSGVTYYVKIRAFIKIGNQVFYGDFSPTKSITTK